jgi:hypothetical protein
VSASTADAGGDVAAVAAQRSRVSSGATAGRAASGVSSAGTARGTPAASSARRSGGSDSGTERTTTASRDHGTPSTRCARRSVSAAHAACRPGVGNTDTVAAPPSGSASGGATRTRPGPVPRSGSMARATASRTAGDPRWSSVSTAVF